jgi:hypothetical protein
MLRASARHHNEDINLLGVGRPHVDVGLPGGRVLSALVEADEMERARTQAIEVLGSGATARAVQVTGNFEMMNRLLDAVGVGPPDGMLAIGDAIGVPLPDRHR